MTHQWRGDISIAGGDTVGDDMSLGIDIQGEYFSTLKGLVKPELWSDPRLLRAFFKSSEEKSLEQTAGAQSTVKIW